MIFSVLWKKCCRFIRMVVRRVRRLFKKEKAPEPQPPDIHIAEKKIVTPDPLEISDGTNFLYAKRYPINDSIAIEIPTVGEILAQESNYYSLVSMLITSPIDHIVLLDDAGIDWTSITDYELFVMLFETVAKGSDTHLIFGDLDLSPFEIRDTDKSEKIELVNPATGAVIDRSIYRKMSAVMCKIHHAKKDRRKPKNDEAKKFMLDRARTKARRHKNKKEKSQLEPLITAMVNATQFKYDFETVKSLTIYQFNESVHQIVRKTNYDNLMHGVYSGTVDSKHLSDKDLNWIYPE